MSELLVAIGKPGVSAFLRELSESSESSFDRIALENDLQSIAYDASAASIQDMIGMRLLQRIGTRFGISSYGRRVALLIEALEGGDIADVFRRLRRLDGSAQDYELVRQGMTEKFFEALAERPVFGRLYLCSPWINLNTRQLSILQYAIMQSEKKAGRQPEVLVITRPAKSSPEEIDKGDSLRRLIGLKAKIFFLSRVHSKLYIREPDDNGGPLFAIVGSENLTQSNYLELGIQINGDTRLVAQLISHFHDLSAYSSEAG